MKTIFLTYYASKTSKKNYIELENNINWPFYKFINQPSELIFINILHYQDDELKQ